MVVSVFIIMLICALASSVGVRRLRKLEPAMVFR
jgi:hypothetical protein